MLMLRTLQRHPLRTTNVARSQNGPLRIKRAYGSGMVELSTVTGDRSHPLLTQSIGAFFDSQVQRFNTKEILRVVHQDIRWSWNELNRRVDQFALGLLRLGLNKGDRLGVWMDNCVEWVVAQFAAAKIGVILVSINPAYVEQELINALNLVQCSALLFSPEFRDSNHLHMLKELIPELKSGSSKLESSRFPSLKHIIHTSKQQVPGMIRFEDMLLDPSQADEYSILKGIEAHISPDDPISIQFTGGTAGEPKGATLTHTNLLNNGLFVGRRIRLTPDDKVCMPLPLHHGFGLVVGNMATITNGASLVYPSGVYEAKSTLEAVSHERCTVLHGVPTMYQDALKQPDFDRFHVGSLRTGVIVGGPCNVELMHQIRDKLTIQDVTVCYGMTETCITFQTLPNDPIEKRTGTVGKILDHMEAKIIGMDGRILPREEPGELLVRGYSIMKGYWQDLPHSKAVVDKEGWFFTGDIAVMDQHDYVSVVGRLKDSILKGGASIVPLEIEQFLSTHPGIGRRSPDYISAWIDYVSVVGVPDEDYGEQICAWVRMKPGHTATEQQIIDYCKNKIAHYKIPKYVIFTNNFPRSRAGYVQKYKMKEESITKLGLKIKDKKVLM